ncbi:MAG: ribonuclease HI [Anaerolineae bacterium]|jgi:ribonuclease HI|nr:ribonuclease HI [Anaerolineae bacterium]
MANRPHVTIYTDGGAFPNPGPGGWGVVLIAANGQEKELSGADPDTTNNRMELTAAIEALRALKVPCEVTFYTDSEYLRQGISEWLPGWIQRDWQRSKDRIVKNQDLWQKLHAETLHHQIDWQWVKGHAGDEYNERVDRLATAAREQLTGTAPAPVNEQLAGTAPAPVDEHFAPEYEIALRVTVAGPEGPGGWAARVSPVDQDAPAAIHTGRETDTTSNRIQLTAALAVLRSLPPGAAARVYCPAAYLYGGMTDWVGGWQARGWVTRGKTPVQHSDLWRALVDEADQRTVEWTLEKRGELPLARGLDALAAGALENG